MMQPCPNTLDREINNEKWKWFGWLGWLGWLGWIGASLVVFGYYLNANMYVSSWLVWTVGNVLVAMYSWHKKAYPTVVMSIIIAAMNIYGYFSWSN
jgi:nicotinamide riboside transporter PnuC